ncbi:DNA-3-methyladenine glycosylase [Microcaecilia unicolor]|uniref:DNA-3-methyladenine glycosylase n=1 Tax=Microcaecilia unicolor TaxID=1415580 RepID=A0A6P7Z018_9AMPH|nr:DNA-3-methyladenine glycosylase [Microcaecilia unicolor]XP_030068855.1 DNA-3-methyladenine glycosylase [Microcaecilia unicolor]
MSRKRRRVPNLDDEEPKRSIPENLSAENLLLTQDGKGDTCSVTSKYFGDEKMKTFRLGSDFFNQPCISLAKSFLGQILVRKLPDGTELRGRIVESEAYLGGEDEASHSARGKQTGRNVAMFMPAGTMYVYQIYGMYFCLNVSSQGEGAAVLLRSLEPLQGLDTMRHLRNLRRKENGKALKDWELCNGPSKLCQALDINKSFDRRDLASDEEVWLEQGPEVLGDQTIIATARIGINYAGEWAQKPLRFYIKGNKCVSVVDKTVERNTI